MAMEMAPQSIVVPRQQKKRHRAAPLLLFMFLFILRHIFIQFHNTQRKEQRVEMKPASAPRQSGDICFQKMAITPTQARLWFIGFTLTSYVGVCLCMCACAHSRCESWWCGKNVSTPFICHLQTRAILCKVCVCVLFTTGDPLRALIRVELFMFRVLLFSPAQSSMPSKRIPRYGVVANLSISLFV